MGKESCLDPFRDFKFLGGAPFGFELFRSGAALRFDFANEGIAAHQRKRVSIQIVEAGASPLSGVIENVSFIGDRQRITVSGVSDRPLNVDAPNTVQAKSGERIGLQVAPESVRLLPLED